MNQSKDKDKVVQATDLEDFEDSSFDIRLYETETFTEKPQNIVTNNSDYVPAIFVDDDDAERYDEIFTDLFRVRA